MKAEMMPQRQTKRSCGYDIYAEKNIVIKKGVWQIVNTHMRFDGSEKILDCDKWFAMVVPRSSYGFKYRLRFSNTVAIIDQDYRDDILLEMTADEDIEIKKGERYAQFIIIPFATFMNEITPVADRIGGLGSTTKQVRFD